MVDAQDAGKRVTGMGLQDEVTYNSDYAKGYRVGLRNQYERGLTDGLTIIGEALDGLHDPACLCRVCELLARHGLLEYVHGEDDSDIEIPDAILAAFEPDGNFQEVWADAIDRVRCVTVECPFPSKRDSDLCKHCEGDSNVDQS